MLIVPPSIVPMGEIVDGCEFDLDATIYDSYPGSGQSFSNIEPSPASGAAQSSYDCYLGAAATVDGDEPTFNGTAGDAAAYFSFGGNDFFQIQGSNTTFIEEIHNTTAEQDFTFVCPFYYTNGAEILFGNRNAGGANIGLILYTTAANDYLFITQRGSTAPASANGTVSLSENSIGLAGFAHDHAADETTFWVNTKTGQTVANAFNTTVAAASGKMTIGAYGNGSSPASAGTRLYGCSMFDRVLTDDEFEAVARQYEVRHNREYL